jgi:hypothetical protein
MKEDVRRTKYTLEDVFLTNYCTMFQRTAVKDHVLRAERLLEGCDSRLFDEWKEIMKTMGLKDREYAAAVDKGGPGGYLEDGTE